MPLRVRDFNNEKLSLVGMDERNGQLLEGLPLLKQQVRRAIRIPKGSVPMLRWFGTEHYRYLAKEITSAALLELTSELSESIEAILPQAKLISTARQENGENFLLTLQLGNEQLSLGI